MRGDTWLVDRLAPDIGPAADVRSARPRRAADGRAPLAGFLERGDPVLSAAAAPRPAHRNRRRDLSPPRPQRRAAPADVFRNRSFLLLWLAQAATQIGGNMVIFGLTVIIAKSTGSTSAVSALSDVPAAAVLFSALPASSSIASTDVLS